MNDQEKIDEHYEDKVEKRVKISRSKAERVERNARLEKCSENEIIDKAIGFWLEFKTLKVERDSSLHLRTTAFEEKCKKCDQTIPAITLAHYNKNLGWVCLLCSADSYGDEALAQKILKKTQLERALIVLQGQIDEKTEKLEVIDNKEKIHELLLQKEQNQKLHYDNAKKLESFFQNFPQYSEPEVKANLKQISTDAKRSHDNLESLTPMLQFLERTATDQMVALSKRRRKTLEASVEDAD